MYFCESSNLTGRATETTIAEVLTYRGSLQASIAQSRVTDTSDAKLIVATLAGNTQAFDVLVTRLNLKEVLAMSTGTLIALTTLTVIVHLALVGLLFLLCIRTRSKGLIVIFATCVGFWVIGVIFQPLFQQYIDQWVGGEVNNWLTESMSIGEFLILFSYIKHLFYGSLGLIGIVLIYKEWRLGKFSPPTT